MNGTNMEETLGTVRRKNWCRRIGEEAGSMFTSRITQGIFVGHHDRTGAVLCITRGVMRGDMWTRQFLKDAWDPSLGRSLWNSVADGGSRSATGKEVTADREGAGPPLPQTREKSS